MSLQTSASVSYLHFDHLMFGRFDPDLECVGKTSGDGVGQMWPQYRGGVWVGLDCSMAARSGRF